LQAYATSFRNDEAHGKLSGCDGKDTIGKWWSLDQRTDCHQTKGVQSKENSIEGFQERASLINLQYYYFIFYI
jgi:hypothetical protein